MKIILLKDIAKLGQRGDIVDVSDSYAINVLIPKNNAIRATPSELANWKQKEDAKKFKKEIETNTFLQLIQKIHNTKIEITGKKVDEKGHLFASIHEKDITDAIYKAINLSIDPKQIILTEHIKSLGRYEIKIKQGKDEEKVEIFVV